MSNLQEIIEELNGAAEYYRDNCDAPSTDEWREPSSRELNARMAVYEEAKKWGSTLIYALARTPNVSIALVFNQEIK